MIRLVSRGSDCPMGMSFMGKGVNPSLYSHVERFNPVVSALRAELKKQEIFSVTAARNCYVQRGETLKRKLETYLSFLEAGDRGDLASIADSVRTLEIIEG